MDDKLAEAVLKLAEVHNRRLGEIGLALKQIADQFTYDTVGDRPPNSIDRLVDALDNISGSLDELQPTAPEDNT